MPATERVIKTSRVVRELVTSTGGGRISLFKVGTVIAIVVGSWIMIYETLQARMNWQYFVVYLFTIGGFTQLGAFMSRYYGGPSPVTPTFQDTPATPAELGKCPDCPTSKSGVTNAPKQDEGSG